MKVYVVLDGDYDSTWVVAVYDSEEAANKHSVTIDGWVEEEELQAAPPPTIEKFTVEAEPGYTRLSWDEGASSSRAPGAKAFVEAKVEAKCEVEVAPEPVPPVSVQVVPSGVDTGWSTSSGHVSVVGYDAREVWDKFWEVMPDAQRQWAEHAEWEHEHPWETVWLQPGEPLPSGIKETFGAFLFATGEWSDDPDRPGSRVSTMRCQGHVIGEDRDARIQYARYSASELERRTTSESR